jgi:plastocyanin
MWWNWFMSRRNIVSLMLIVSANSAWAEMNAIGLDEQGIQRATIIMDSYSYSPKDLSVQAGKPVEFTFKNTATITPHTFVVDDPAVGLLLRTEVSAGDTQIIRFTPMRSGSVIFYCDKKLLFFKSHRERGQEGHLEIR